MRTQQRNQKLSDGYDKRETLNENHFAKASKENF